VETKKRSPTGPQSPKEIPVARAVNTVSTGGQRNSDDFTISLLAVIGLRQAWRAALFLIFRKSVFHPR
jgi:hypothetical protein